LASERLGGEKLRRQLIRRLLASEKDRYGQLDLLRVKIKTILRIVRGR
jgi:hypothetical protein